MAEQQKLPIPALPQTAYTAKQGRRRKTLEEKREARRAAARRRQESCRTRVYIGAAFDRWKNLKDSEGLKSDAELALLLLDSYERNRPVPVPTHGRRLPARGSRSAPDRQQAAGVQPNSPAEEAGLYQVEVSLDWDDTWDQDTWEEGPRGGASLTSSEEDMTLELNSDDEEDSDEECVQPVRAGSAGAPDTELCLGDGGGDRGGDGGGDRGGDRGGDGGDGGSGPDAAADVHAET